MVILITMLLLCSSLYLIEFLIQYPQPSLSILVLKKTILWKKYTNGIFQQCVVDASFILVSDVFTAVSDTLDLVSFLLRNWNGKPLCFICPSNCHFLGVISPSIFIWSFLNFLVAYQLPPLHPKAYPIIKEVPAVATQAGIQEAPPEPATMSLISECRRLDLSFIAFSMD